MAKGYLAITQATLTVGTANYGSGFPRIGEINSPSLTVTAPEINNGTIYIACSAAGFATVPHRAVAQRETQFIPLTAGQSFTFSGMARGNGADRDIKFGAPYTYILGSGAGQDAIITYYEWD